MRIGIDVGGTNTDAVLMAGDRVLASTKSPTTKDVTGGVIAAISGLLAAGAGALSDIDAVMIGTTHFTNAFVEGRGLAKVAVVRLGLPATTSFPPMIDWPDAARAGFVAESFLCHGGHEFDGREISPIDPDELADVASKIVAGGFESVAITAVFSLSSPSAELAAAEIFGRLLPGIPLSLSHEIGRMGLLERENATIINASLRGISSGIVAAFRRAVADFGIDAPVYVSQNDGTLGTLDFTERYPVATFTSGPTNSMRGAAFLSGEKECIVIDIGGTTADIGVVSRGFPREAGTDVQVGGVRTNFRLPDVVSLGIGGGSIVLTGERVAVGPQSVGYAIREEAIAFGGGTLTATDLAIASGRVVLGDPERLADLDPRVVAGGLGYIEAHIAEAVDRMRTSSDPVTVVLVGGGSVLLGDELDGVARTLRPENFAVANAVGAAIAQVGAECERIVDFSDYQRDEAVHETVELAREMAIEAGADPATVQIIDVDEIPVAYLPGNTIRIKVKAVGDLLLEESYAPAN